MYGKVSEGLKKFFFQYVGAHWKLFSLWIFNSELILRIFRKQFFWRNLWILEKFLKELSGDIVGKINNGMSKYASEVNYQLKQNF